MNETSREQIVQGMKRLWNKIGTDRLSRIGNKMSWEQEVH